jgi:hypothetical protein
MIDGPTVNVKDYGAIGDGVANDTAAIQAAIDAYANANLIFEFGKTYLVSTLDFSNFSGTVTGVATIKSDETADSILINMTGTQNLVWDGPILDMSQTGSTTGSDPRCRWGFYLIDARNITLVPKVINVARDYPLYISGTSSQAGAGLQASWGSKYIYVHNMKIEGTPGQGQFGQTTRGLAEVVVRSDFYTGGGAYFEASNGVKTSDYTIDATVSYPATTEYVYFYGGQISTCDRFGFLNVKNVYEYDTVLINMGKRGLAAAPTCDNVHFDGGSIGGGLSSCIHFNYVSTNCSAQNKHINPEYYDGTTVGPYEASGLQALYGSAVNSFSNISGYAGAVRAVWIVGSSFIDLDNIVLRSHQVSDTVNGVEINAGPGGNASSWQMANVRVRNSVFESEVGYAHNITTGTATYASGAIELRSNVFLNSSYAVQSDYLVSPNVTNSTIFTNNRFSSWGFLNYNPTTYALSEQFDTFGNAGTATWQEGKYDIDALPDSVNVGSTFILVNGQASAPDSSKQGVLQTVKLTPRDVDNNSAGYRKYIYQVYYTANNTDSSGSSGNNYFYFRKATSNANTWQAWKYVQGL